MKNPLNKRFKREFRQDFGKYLVIFLFMVMLVSIVSGYLVVASSIEKTFYEGYDKYNVEDGHITFSKEPDEEVLSKLEEKSDLKFYDLKYFEENVNDTDSTLRVFKDRQEVDLESIVDGVMPEADDEIALDRLFARNNNISIGDNISLNGKSLKVVGTVALVDYNCLFEDPNDMMFNSLTFGVGVMTSGGYDSVESIHQYYNYAFKYNEACETEAEENEKSEAFIDDLEDVIKEYDTEIIQLQVNDLYARANEISDTLSDEFEDASDVMEDKITEASKNAAKKAIESLSAEKKMELFMKGASSEEYFEAAVEEQNTTEEALVAKELGCSEQALKDLKDASEDMDSTMDSADIKEEAPVINLDDYEDDEDYETDMDFSTSDIRDMVAKIDAVGIYDTTDIKTNLDELDELLDYEFDEKDFLEIDSYVPRYENQAITYCMDDMSGDKPMYMLFAYIVIGIMAFVFAITTSGTIASEAGAIGTLRASGYTRGELVRHYLFIPVVVTLLAAVIGNILGYTVFTDLYKGIFYNSFCLANYEPYFNSEAFIDTTIIPLIIMIGINLYVLTSKMKLSPIKFLRHELKTKVKRRAVLLNKKLPFMHRFRLRILFQNIPAYITLCIGIIFGGMIAIFGWMFGPLLENYADRIIDSKICEYQYVLSEEKETDTKGAEKYCLTTLDSTVDGYLTDEISVYGLVEDSKYITMDIPQGQALITNCIADKFGLDAGDTITLKDPYESDTYEFTIAGVYHYDGCLGVFIDRDDYTHMFHEDDDYFTGYFTNEEIDDIDEKYIVTIVTGEDLVDIANQLLNSMGSFMSVFAYFGMIMFLLLMYLLTKQIIEKNMQSIAMTKILGYSNTEIAGLYLVITSFVVIVSLLISIPVTDSLLRYAFSDYLYKEITGYIPFMISKNCYVREVILGIGCYIVVSIFMMRKIGKIPKSEALKNLE